MSDAGLVSAPSRPVAIATWVLQGVLAAVFLAAAAAKLAGAPMMVEVFAQIGIGQWFRFVTAGVEILGAVALLAPGYAGFGALWLAATMVGATLAHLLVLHTPPVPALALLALNLLVAWLRRDQVAGLLRPFQGRIA